MADPRVRIAMRLVRGGRGGVEEGGGGRREDGEGGGKREEGRGRAAGGLGGGAEESKRVAGVRGAMGAMWFHVNALTQRHDTRTYVLASRTREPTPHPTPLSLLSHYSHLAMSAASRPSSASRAMTAMYAGSAAPQKQKERPPSATKVRLYLGKRHVSVCEGVGFQFERCQVLVRGGFMFQCGGSV